ncbi:MAG: hypothetical protein JKX76_01310 [Colwellia sp.]|nr:hypothetical protein [Colwellia sp.]
MSSRNLLQMPSDSVLHKKHKVGLAVLAGVAAHNFILDFPINKIGKGSYFGTCPCGMKNSVSREYLQQQTWCRNPTCNFYKAKKKLSIPERVELVFERGCQFLEFKTEGANDAVPIEFICVCGFRQIKTWRIFESKQNPGHWCFWDTCTHYKKPKKNTTEDAIMYFRHGNLEVADNFVYDDIHTPCELTCPNGYISNMSLQQFKNGKRCECFDCVTG